MFKIALATGLALSVLAAGFLYHGAAKNYSDNPAFQKIFANAVTVKVFLANPTAKTKKTAFTSPETLSDQSHPQQLRWFQETNQFNPSYLDCPWDGGAIVVTDSDKTEHILSYYRGALKCDDMPRATAPTGTAIMSAPLYAWIESHRPRPVTGKKKQRRNNV